MRLFVGGYSADMDGRAAGIGVLRAGDAESTLAGTALTVGPDAVAVEGSPSWLAWHPTLDVVYAALEGAGAVRAFRRAGPESLVALGAPVAVGELPCHLAVEPGGRWLIASCWGDGRVVRVALDEAGAPTRAVLGEGLSTAHSDSGMDAGDLRALLASLGGGPSDEVLREAGVSGASTDPSDDRPSRAHQARFLPGGVVVTTDMGRDEIRIWRATTAGLREVERVTLPRGTGPRHTVWHPSGHLFVVTELSLELFVLAPSLSGDRGWRIVGGVPLSPAAEAGRDFASEIALSREAEFVYVGIRGANTIATLRVRGTGSELAPVALVDAGVDWPRHHVVVRDTLLVAGQKSDDAASLTLDLRTGVPGRVRQRVDLPSPTVLLPDRAARA